MIACVQMKLRADDYRAEANFSDKNNGHYGTYPPRIGCGAPPFGRFPPRTYRYVLPFVRRPPSGCGPKNSFAAASKALLFGNFPSAGYHLLAHRVSPVRALLLARAAETERIYLSTFIRAAREYGGAWIVAGSAILRWGGETSRVYNTAPVITPTGHVIYRQHKVNLVEMEGRGGLDIEGAPPLNYMSVVQSPPSAI